MQKARTVMVERGRLPYATLIVKRTLADPSIPEANKQAMKNIIMYHQSRGTKPNTLLKWCYCFERFIRALRDVEIPKATKQDIEAAFADIECQPMAAETKRQIKCVVKGYFKWSFGDDEFYPQQVRWLKTTNKSSDRLLPTDLIDENDVIKMIEVSKNRRDKAIIALLFERGLRASELLGIKKKDVNLLENPPYIIVNISKTMPRRIPITFSAGYIAEWLATEEMKALPQEACIWQSMNPTQNFGYFSLRSEVKELAKRAKITKKVYLHLFRHSAASRMASEVPESVLREIMGWSKKSDQPSRYVHLSGATVDHALLKMDGIEEEEHTTKLQTRQCPACRFPNTRSAYHCARCQAALEIKTADELMKNKDLMRRIVAKAISSDSFFEGIIKDMRN